MRICPVVLAFAVGFLGIHCGSSPTQYQTCAGASPAEEAHASYDWFGSMGNIAIYKTTTNDLMANGGSTYLIGNVKTFEVNDGWIVALLNDANKSLVGKVGINGTWVNLDYNVNAFRVFNGYIGEVKAGTLYVKQGMSGTWVNEISNAQDFRLYSTGAPNLTIVVLLNDGTLKGKSGINGTWQTLAGNIRSFKMDQGLIAAFDNNNTLWAKNGFGGTWVNEYSGAVIDYDITLYGELFMLLGNSNLMYKYGLNGAWQVIYNNITNFVAVSSWYPGAGSIGKDPLAYVTKVCALEYTGTLHGRAVQLGSWQADKVLFLNVLLFNFFGVHNNTIVTVLAGGGSVYTWNAGTIQAWPNITNLADFMQW
jgi:hypothetical protein